MADLATIDDVQENFRPLRGQELATVPTWLLGAQAELRSRVSDLDARIAADPANYGVDVTKAVVLAILRWLHGKWESPFFFTQEEIDKLRGTAQSASSGLPVGAFPDLVEYPVY